MQARVVKGNKREIADAVSRMSGDVREAIVFVADTEPASAGNSGSGKSAANSSFFGEMDAFTVSRGDADDSRESIHGRMPNE